MRVGIGFDAHAFDEARLLTLGGVTVPNAPGLAGWSDGDVLTHALMDAILGAAALGDIGQHFPSSEVPEGVSSIELLGRVVILIGEAGYRVAGADSVVISQQVSLAEFKGEMAKRLASTLEIDSSSVAVKATTTDHLGFTGRGEGIAAMAVATLEDLS